jgi:hypothetical protein
MRTASQPIGGPSDYACDEPTTTDDYQVWAHGFAVTATLFHCRHVLAALIDAPATLEQLCAHTEANSGHLAVMLRTLRAVRWVSRSAVDGMYSTARSVATCAASPTLARLCEDVYGEMAESEGSAAWGAHLPRLAHWLPCIGRGWELPSEAAEVEHLGTMLAGAVIAPLLLELRMLSSSYTAKADEGRHEHASADVSLASVDDDTAYFVGGFFVAQGWGEYQQAAK